MSALCTSCQRNRRLPIEKQIVIATNETVRFVKKAAAEFRAYQCGQVDKKRYLKWLHIKEATENRLKRLGRQFNISRFHGIKYMAVSRCP